jgi:predicted Zn-dependent peptidase
MTEVLLLQATRAEADSAGTGEAGPQPELLIPSMLEHVTGTGLRVAALRQPSVPLAEVRLRVPFGSMAPGHAARARLLAACVLSRSADGQATLMERTRGLGASLSVAAGPDDLLFTGSVLASGLEELLTLLATALVTVEYDEREVAVQRARMGNQLTMARSRASTRAREMLRGHLFGAHPYARDLPEPAELAAVTAGDLCALHQRRLVPEGSVLVLVGDVVPERATMMAERVTAGWSWRATAAEDLPSLPSTAPAGVSRLFHRAGSVQSSIRIGGPAVRRNDSRFASLQLANLIYGGYFSSRLVENIREEKGYTYSPRSVIEHSRAGSTLVAEADVATRHTAPALLEMWYELGRLSTMRPADTELDSARHYAVGGLAMSVATQAGLASTLVTLLGDGLDLEWVRGQPARLAQVTAHDIYQLGIHLLAPNLLAAVVIGDATQCAEPLKAFGPWEVVGIAPGEARHAGLSGIVIWGLHRDSPELRGIRLPVYSQGALPAGPQRLDPQEPDALTVARFGRHTITGDDFVLADDDGVLFLPLDHAADIAKLATGIRDRGAIEE